MKQKPTLPSKKELLPFKHGEEGTHWICDSRWKKEGGKARCCECRPHKGCDEPPQPQHGDVEGLIKEIMQAGFDVAMGGRYDKLEEWNKDWQEKEYDKVVKKYTTLLTTQREEAVKEERERIKGKIGWLRQWLNEKPADEMVTNKHIEHWLELSTPQEKKV